MPRSRLKLVLAAAALAGMAGCSQNPQFRMAIASQAYGSLEALYVLLAKAELGALRSPSSFGDEVETYATVIGGFEASRLLVAGALDPNGPAAVLDQSIDGCVARVRQMSVRHRATGIPADPALLGGVRSVCDAATRQVAAEAASSWLFSTAAGDL
jgi:hypothetical protein